MAQRAVDLVTFLSEPTDRLMPGQYFERWFAIRNCTNWTFFEDVRRGRQEAY